MTLRQAPRSSRLARVQCKLSHAARDSRTSHGRAQCRDVARSRPANVGCSADTGGQGSLRRTWDVHTCARRRHASGVAGSPVVRTALNQSSRIRTRTLELPHTAGDGTHHCRTCVAWSRPVRRCKRGVHLGTRQGCAAVLVGSCSDLPGAAAHQTPGIGTCTRTKLPNTARDGARHRGACSVTLARSGNERWTCPGRSIRSPLHSRTPPHHSLRAC